MYTIPAQGPHCCQRVQLRSPPAHAQGNEQVLVLEHCATDLERLLARAGRPLPPHLAAAIFRQLLQAVTACHSSGARLHNLPYSQL